MKETPKKNQKQKVPPQKKNRKNTQKNSITLK